MAHGKGLRCLLFNLHSLNYKRGTSELPCQRDGWLFLLLWWGHIPTNPICRLVKILQISTANLLGIPAQPDHSDVLRMDPLAHSWSSYLPQSLLCTKMLTISCDLINPLYPLKFWGRRTTLGWTPPAIKLAQSRSSEQFLCPLLFWSDTHKGSRWCQGFLSWHPHPTFPWLTASP